MSSAEPAIELFVDRTSGANRFHITDDNGAAVTEVCRRFDAMPLAIEPAAARVRVLSIDEIVCSLHDCFPLLTGSTERAPASTEPIACAQHRTDMRARLFEELRWHAAGLLVSDYR